MPISFCGDDLLTLATESVIERKHFSRHVRLSIFLRQIFKSEITQVVFILFTSNSPPSKVQCTETVSVLSYTRPLPGNVTLRKA